MGTDERDRERSEEEPDVEGHMHRKLNPDEDAKEPEDKGDDTPDVEAHMHKAR